MGRFLKMVMILTGTQQYISVHGELGSLLPGDGENSYKHILHAAFLSNLFNRSHVEILFTPTM